MWMRRGPGSYRKMVPSPTGTISTGIPYYGYNGWYLDVIRDYGNRNDLTDTLHEALEEPFRPGCQLFWYQFGGMFPNTIPCTASWFRSNILRPNDSTVFPKRSTIPGIQFEKCGMNPSYLSIVGGTAILNFQRIPCTSTTSCASVDTIVCRLLYPAVYQLPGPYLLQAKNYLNSCTKRHSFTYGDNDTLPVKW